MNLVKLYSWMLLGCLLALGLLFAISLKSEHAPLPTVTLNHPFPAFERMSLSGHVVNRKLLQGRVTVLNVWASWCLTCVQEWPALMSLAKQPSIQLLGLSWKDPTTDAQAFLKHHGDPYQQVISDPNGRLGIDLGVYGVPETFVIDSEGVIRYRYIGELNQTVIAEKLMPVIKQWSHS